MSVCVKCIFEVKLHQIKIIFYVIFPGFIRAYVLMNGMAIRLEIRSIWDKLSLIFFVDIKTFLLFKCNWMKQLAILSVGMRRDFQAFIFSIDIETFLLFKCNWMKQLGTLRVRIRWGFQSFIFSIDLKTFLLFTWNWMNNWRIWALGLSIVILSIDLKTFILFKCNWMKQLAILSVGMRRDF